MLNGSCGPGIVATGAFLRMGGVDLTVLNHALDPLILVLYALAWLRVFGALLTVWATARFRRLGVGVDGRASIIL